MRVLCLLAQGKRLGHFEICILIVPINQCMHASIMQKWCWEIVLSRPGASKDQWPTSVQSSKIFHRQSPTTTTTTIEMRYGLVVWSGESCICFPAQPFHLWGRVRLILYWSVVPHLCKIIAGISLLFGLALCLFLNSNFAFSSIFIRQHQRPLQYSSVFWCIECLECGQFSSRKCEHVCITYSRHPCPP